MKQYLDRYFAEDFPGREQSTIHSHKVYLGHFFDHCPARIDVEVYAGWVDHAFATWAERTARNVALAASSRFLSWCERQGLIAKSPHRLVRLPEPKKHAPREPFTEEEYRSLLSDADESDEALAWAMRLGWECGTSMADACLLKWSSVDLTGGVLMFDRRKTDEPCVIPLAPDGEVLSNLWDLSELPRSAEWPNKPPGIIYVRPRLAADYLVALKTTSAGLQKRFARLRERVLPGSKKSFHNLRASFCSTLANGGMNLAAACRLSGHRDPKIFRDYVTADVKQLREQMMKARASG